MDKEDDNMEAHNNIYEDEDYVDYVQKNCHVYESYLWATYTHLRLAKASLEEQFKKGKVPKDLEGKLNALIDELEKLASENSDKNAG